MKLSGYNFILTPKTQDMSFVFQDVVVDNTGVAEIGFYGANNKFFFLFSEGKLIDPSNNFVYAPAPSESITISGDFGGTQYRYYINGVLASDGKGKASFAAEKFYTNSTGCQINMGLAMACPKIPYEIQTAGQFIAGGVLNGKIINKAAGSEFSILDSEIEEQSQTKNWTGYITGIVPGGGELDFQIFDVSNTTAFQGAPATLKFRTTIGDIRHTISPYRASGSTWGSSSISISENIPIVVITSPVAGSGDSSQFTWLSTPTQEQRYTIDYSFKDGEGQLVDKPIYITLESSGNVTDQYTNTGQYVYKWLTYDSGCHYCTEEGEDTTPCDWRVGSGSYLGIPDLNFTTYSKVKTVSFNTGNIFSSNTPEKIPMLFSGLQNEGGTGASGYFLTEPFQLNVGTLYGGDGINWRRITGYELTNFGTGYTKMPAVLATTGIAGMLKDQAGNLTIPVMSGFTTATDPNGFGTGHDVAYQKDVFVLSKFEAAVQGEYEAGYLTGVPYYDHTGNGVYGFSGILITNPGSGYDPSVYKPRISFERLTSDTLGERGHCSDSQYDTKSECIASGKTWYLDGDDASGEFIWNKQGATYDFDTAWNLETGRYEYGIKTGEVDFKSSNLISNNKYSSFAWLPSSLSNFYLTLKFNNLSLDETISSKLVISGSGVIEEVGTSVNKSYSTHSGMAWIPEGNSESTQGSSFLTNYFG